MEARQLLSAVVTTDAADYAFGSIAQITASGFAEGATVTFQVTNVPPTEENLNHPQNDPWTVVDGGADDLDREANGTILTTWAVNDPDAVGATYLLTATGDGEVATTTFTDGKPGINTVDEGGETTGVDSHIYDAKTDVFIIATDLTESTTYYLQVTEPSQGNSEIPLGGPAMQGPQKSRRKRFALANRPTGSSADHSAVARTFSATAEWANRRIDPFDSSFIVHHSSFIVSPRPSAVTTIPFSPAARHLSPAGPFLLGDRPAGPIRASGCYNAQAVNRQVQS